MNNKINYKCFSSLIFFLSEYMFLGAGFNQLFSTSKNNTIISIIIGFIIGFIILFLYKNIFNYKSNLDLNKKIESLYGKTIGNIINYLLVFLVILFFIYTLWNTQIYIQNKYLDNTPNYIIVILFLLPIIYCIKKGINTFTKISLMTFIISIFEIILIIFGIISYIEIDNFKPFFNTNIINTFKSSYYYISFFFTPLILLLCIPKKNIDNNSKIKNSSLFFIFISFFNLLFLIIAIIGTFSIELASTLNYPEFVLVKKINYFNFIEHIENILSTQWLYTLFMVASLCTFYIKVFLENKKISTIFLYLIILISSFISLRLFNNTTIGYNFIKSYYHIISLLIFFFLIISNILIKIKH